MSKTTVWIDLDNSPHVPLFAPIIEELQARRLRLFVTARDAYQVKELADFYGVECTLIGRHYGKHFWMKLAGVVVRGCQLLPSVRRERPTLSISHGSRSQLVVSWLLGIPSLLISDYEHARTSAMIRPTWVLLPDSIPAESVRGARGQLLRYPGIKEDVYVPRFKPDLTVRERLGLRSEDLVVVVRPPASEAHYHVPEGDTLFRDVVEYLSSHDRVRMILLPRNQSQALSIRQMWPELIASSKGILPAHVEDGLNLIWTSDLVISGGGTMNREAAAMGVPVYSIFQGPMGAVDRSLEAQGRLVIVRDASEVRSKIVLQSRAHGAIAVGEGKTAMTTIVGHIATILDRLEPLSGAASNVTPSAST